MQVLAIRREKNLEPLKTKRKIKRALSSQKPTVWIGKNGVSPKILLEIDKQLEKVGKVKMRVLKSAFCVGDTRFDGVEAIAGEIALQTKSTIVEVRGHTVILYREKKKRST